MSRSRLLGLMVILALIAVLVVAPLPSDAFHSKAAPLPPRVTEANGVTREVLSDGMPAKAPGQLLLLLRFTFVPGAVIPPHTHPGMQTAYVVSGTLGYTVFCGYAEVVRAVTDGIPQQRERLEPGPETFFHPGDAFTEVDGIVHAGRNAGPDPLVLLVSSLLKADAPASSPASPGYDMGDHIGSC
jgi:quercetin dioxygenase-like cupin family protein